MLTKYDFLFRWYINKTHNFVTSIYTQLVDKYLLQKSVNNALEIFFEYIILYLFLIFIKN